MRADRLAVSSERIEVLAETELTSIMQVLEQVKPMLIIVDSIQTLYTREVNALPGTCMIDVSSVSASTSMRSEETASLSARIRSCPGGSSPETSAPPGGGHAGGELERESGLCDPRFTSDGGGGAAHQPAARVPVHLARYLLMPPALRRLNGRRGWAAPSSRLSARPRARDRSATL